MFPQLLLYFLFGSSDYKSAVDVDELDLMEDTFVNTKAVRGVFCMVMNDNCLSHPSQSWGWKLVPDSPNPISNSLIEAGKQGWMMPHVVYNVSYAQILLNMNGDWI